MKKFLLIIILIVFTLSACAGDETPPILEGFRNIEYTIGDALPDLTAGISATDDTDGTISDEIAFDTSDVDFSTPGTYKVIVSVSDQAGNETIETFDVVVLQERIAPVLSGTTNLSFERGTTNPNYLEGVSANDNVDGDITSSIVVDSSEVDLNSPGTYDLIFSVTDAAGNLTEVTITVTVTGLTDMEMVMEDIAAYKENQMISPNQINLSKKGQNNESRITWRVNHPNISSEGIVLPLHIGEESEIVSYTGTFRKGTASVVETFTMTIHPYDGVELSNSKEVTFFNQTTEYDVKDGNLMLYFEDGGSVPYVNVETFLTLLEGFIDPKYDLLFTVDNNQLSIYYEYYDEDEDYTYELEVIIDSENDTITTNDPGFYWAYVYSTQTNFGRNINYVDLPDEEFIEGEDIVYDLSKFRLDIVKVEDQILLPFYIVNQLFVGSSYYNVYYNYDALYGIYSTPSSDSETFELMRTSSLNNESIPIDLLIHNYDVLVFNLEYFYGLKSYLNIDSFYELTEKYISKLLSQQVRTVEISIRDLLLRDIDEPHTSFSYASYFNNPGFAGPPTNTLAVYGTRFNDWYNNGLFAIDEQIEAKWGREGITSTAWAANSLSRPDFWFLDDAKEYAVVGLDGFRTSDIYEAMSFDAQIFEDIFEISPMILNLPSIVGGTKYFFYNNSTQDHLIMELLVKGLSANTIEAYQASLITNGFTFVQEESENEDKQDGYYTKTVNDIHYMLQLEYNETYDLFYLGLINDVPETYEEDWNLIKDSNDLVNSDSAVYMEETLENVFATSPQTKHIVLDITWNTGGNVGALYRILGFITQDPFKVSRLDGSTGSKSTSYVQIENTPYYENVSWSLLTSKVSFSAANSLATIFKYNDLGSVIGMQTGGGASSITPILLPIGTAFSMSSNSVSAYRTGDGTEDSPYEYFDNELGIIPDIALDITEIYNNQAILNAILNED